ncbi:heterokaryon incompatibility protein-domain-containing protein [Paraphoma chrysanthemicola]|nr:heterokaryon incompatibility protein-domain-containing protein [Paraphoma chrysanthemicola]
MDTMIEPTPDQPGGDLDKLGPIYEDIPELCDFCVELTTMMVEGDLSPTPLESLPEPKHCEFCKMLLKELDEIKPSQSQNPPCLKSLVFQKHATPARFQTRRICGGYWYGNGFVFRDTYQFAMWAEKDSTACTTLTDIGPIIRPDMRYASDLARYWLGICKTHPKCSSDDDKLLPSRVLELYGGHPGLSLKLVDGRPKKGRYLALSHCWGSIKNRPLRTTRPNIEKHKLQISLSDLPKTFQDFVEFAQGLGVKYIWIDSLCIIQDDREDWHSEAERMGDVYRNAALVVAASGAKDSTEGLHVTDWPRTVVYRLPYRNRGVCDGTFNLTRVRKGQLDPINGALDTRAWALQEQYLARRMVTFMPGGMSWICESISYDELGRETYYNQEKVGWLKLLISYSAKALTYPSDRLEALKGIAAQLQRSRTDQYHPKYGVWQNRFIEQLFWLHVGPQNDDGALNLPSWSWAATQSKKIWPTDSSYSSNDYVRLLRADELTRPITITAAGCIQMVGLLGTTQSHAHHTRAGGAAWTGTQRILDSSFDIFSSGMSSSFNLPRFLFGSKDTGEVVDGIAFFDQEKRTSCTHHLLAFKANKIPRALPGAQQYNGKDTDEIDAKRALLDVDFIYWTLLLDHVKEGKYKRVGVGVLFPSAYEAFKVEYKDIELV